MKDSQVNILTFLGLITINAGVFLMNYKVGLISSGISILFLTYLIGVKHEPNG